MGDPFFYSLLLFDMIFQSVVLRNVVEAVFRPVQQVSLTILLMLVMMFSFAMFGISTSVAVNYAEATCENMLDCYITTVYEGLRMGGGIGDFLTPITVMQTGNWGLRALFDLLFFFLISVILFNIIAGIIIDMFSALRDKTNERLDKRQNFDLVSGLSRFELDNAAVKYQALLDDDDKNAGMAAVTGYNDHIHNRQNIWDYMYFMFYLKVKDPTEYTGPEKKIQQLQATQDTRWLPIGKAIIVELASASPDTKGDSEEGQAAEGNEWVLAEQSEQIRAVRKELRRVSEQVAALRNEHYGMGVGRTSSARELHPQRSMWAPP